MITNKKIVVTGATSGIGLAVTKILAQGSGNKILAVGRKTEKIDGMFDSSVVIPFRADVSTKEGVDSVFEAAIEKLGGIDIFYANAGFPYFEKMDYVDWDRIKAIFDTNVFSPIYSYQKMVQYLDGREGRVAITCSAMGEMALPGYALYTATKFALRGWQEAMRLEIPRNVGLTVIYPVGTATNFFAVGTGKGDKGLKKPFPIQKVDACARKIVEGLEKEKDEISPLWLWSVSRILFKFLPIGKKLYWLNEKRKFEAFLKTQGKKNH
ncbi:MAG: SDR family NAD(P)-dependent oxidoreductase [Ruminococcaceae bacterium]|nr:SDR family NAD(P)-dependent oxidoreductase [Oscillospiraceae bacterium]